MTRVKLRVWTQRYDEPIEFWVEVDGSGGATLRQVDGPGCGSWLQAPLGITVEVDGVEHEPDEGEEDA